MLLQAKLKGKKLWLSNKFVKLCKWLTKDITGVFLIGREGLSSTRQLLTYTECSEQF